MFCESCNVGVLGGLSFCESCNVGVLGGLSYFVRVVMWVCWAVCHVLLSYFFKNKCVIFKSCPSAHLHTTQKDSYKIPCL